MSIVNKTLVWPLSTVITARGQSSIWKGKVTIAPFVGEFALLVRGDKESADKHPTQAQEAAFAKIVNSGKLLQQQAGQAAIDLLIKAEFIVPKEVTLTLDNIWEYLTASLIEVAQPDYMPGHVYIQIGVEIPWYREQLLEISTLDGVFQEVTSYG